MSHFAWIVAFVALASPCTLALENHPTIAKSSPQARAGRENTSPSTAPDAQTNPHDSALVMGKASNPQVIQQTWSVQQGAPQYIESLAQTADGYLWLGGASGLFRFDGTRFERFHAASGEPLLSTNVHSVFAAPRGGLWVGYTLEASAS
jgi:hypothetical protein